MAWRTLVGLLASALPGFVATGCVSGPPGRPADSPEAAAPRAKLEVAQVSRFQKPEDQPAGGAQSASEPGRPGSSEVAVRIRAKVNGVAILDEELKNATYAALTELRNRPEPQRSALQKQVLERALENLIEREVILAEVFSKFQGKGGEKVLESLRSTANKKFDEQVRQMKKQARCETDEQFKQLLLMQGQSLEGMRRQFERTLMATEYMRYLVLTKTDKFGLPEVRDYYRQHPNEFQTVDSVTWQDIFISAARHGGLEEARRVAMGVVAQAKAGADFPKLSDQYDEGTSKFRGGEGYGRRRGEIEPAEVEPYLFQMRDGEIGPLVTLATGVHIIKLVKREHAGLMPLNEKTQKLILDKLKNEAAEREWKKKVKELSSKAIIERDLTP
jgi:parvulin-like peptidyl-prolyl isomerase